MSKVLARIDITSVEKVDCIYCTDKGLCNNIFLLKKVKPLPFIAYRPECKFGIENETCFHLFKKTTKRKLAAFDKLVKEREQLPR
jgi:hypothetical protein